MASLDESPASSVPCSRCLDAECLCAEGKSLAAASRLREALRRRGNPAGLKCGPAGLDGAEAEAEEESDEEEVLIPTGEGDCGEALEAEGFSLRTRRPSALSAADQELLRRGLRLALRLVPDFLGLAVSSSASSERASEAASASLSFSAADSSSVVEDSRLLDGTVLRGGTTNTLLRVWARACPTKSCLIRFYGHNTSLWIDRQREIAILKLLSAQRNGKRILASFEGGVIESWVGGKPLSPPELRSNKAAIARQLAQLHETPVTAEIAAFDSAGRPLSHLWPALHNLFTLCVNERNRLSPKSKGPLAAVDIEALRQKLELLETRAKGRGSVVLCHSDLLAGNIIKLPDGAVRFIDFEYAAAMERGYDVANHFLEYAGMDCNWDLLPSPSEQKEFLTHYLRSSSAGSATSADVEDLLSEVEPFFPVSHLFWGLWGLVQTANSTVNFDFAGYAFRRLERIGVHVELPRNAARFPCHLQEEVEGHGEDETRLLHEKP